MKLMSIVVIAVISVCGTLHAKDSKVRKPNQTGDVGKDPTEKVFDCADDKAVNKACESAALSLIHSAEATGAKVVSAYRTTNLKYQNKPVCLTTITFSDRKVSIYKSELIDIGQMTGSEGAGKCFFETVGTSAEKIK